MGHAIGPRFQSGSSVSVLDGIVASLPRVRPQRIRLLRRRGKKPPLKLFPRRYWRGGRDELLRRYSEATGLHFTVVETAPYWAPGYPAPAPDADLPLHGQIRLARTEGRGWAYWRLEWHDPAFPKGKTTAGAAVCQPYIGYLCHEFGHVLGLEHREGGGVTDPHGPGGGCMDYVGSYGWELPDGHDLEALQEHYTTGR